ncbi:MULTISPECIES: helix-turn-helix domain-containing protein [Nocardia]|uniref:Helix-turn-helix protein n=2 Tax=Nocardia TaxID=1817 RepID=A0A4R6P5G1_NOCIG|nr:MULTISPECIES: helix-turn-helix transcriptional regulator [Nocardia]MCA2209209.1 helix-turn-helix domain-containing protein [Nocardia rosealba]NKX89267.1 helix-turn-helix transcriptional regulator [Nocardia coubleae]TDP32290.1 helix-turn-helix protein [Nocardia ignorata]
MNTGTGKVIQERRRLLGLSQPALATAIGVSSRQITRYESEEQSPTLPVAIRLADALRISLAELAGIVDNRVDLAGRWWAAWQKAAKHGDEVEVAEVTIRHEGDHLLLDTAETAAAEDDPGPGVRGEMRVWDGDAITGWVRGMDVAFPVGTIYYSLHPQGAHAVGSWTTKSGPDGVVRGWSALAREKSDAEKLLLEMLRGDGVVESWPGARSD